MKNRPHLWPLDFPPVQILGKGFMTQHRSYHLAKFGDLQAAKQVVKDLGSIEDFWYLAYMYPNCWVVPVAKPSGNKIAYALAEKLVSETTGLRLHTRIAQYPTVRRTGKSRWYRLANRPHFFGPVHKGDYILLDDFVTTGGTLAELRWYIESFGGRVLAMGSLSANYPNTLVACQHSTYYKLLDKYGQRALDTFAMYSGMYEGCIEGITHAEAAALLNVKDLNEAAHAVLSAKVPTSYLFGMQ